MYIYYPLTTAIKGVFKMKVYLSIKFARFYPNTCKSLYLQDKAYNRVCEMIDRYNGVVANIEKSINMFRNTKP